MPLAVLGVGSFIGALLAWRMRSESATNTVDGDKDDGLRQYDALIRQLAEESVPEKRAGLELEAARLLRAIETKTAEPVTAQGRTTVPSTPPAPSSAFAGFAWGVVTMAAIGGLLYFASRGSAPRDAGGSPTGGGLPGASSMGQKAVDGSTPAQDDSVLRELESGVRANPKDIVLRMRLARAYLERRELVPVYEQTQAVLEISPEHAEALTYQALVRVAMGQAKEAEEMLTRAIAKDPDIPDAYIHMALARIQLGNAKGAAQAIEAAKKRFPSDASEFDRIFAQISVPSDKNAAQTPPIAGPAADAPGESGGGDSIVAVVDLAQGVNVPEGAMLFVYVREASIETGPPIAVKRLPARNFPMTVTITNADSMAGESLPGLVRVEARVDRDGDPITKDPNDPRAVEDPVRPGGGQLLLVLKSGK